MIFYENHIDVLPTQTVTALLPHLKQSGLGVYCAEDPCSNTADKFLDLFQNYNQQAIQMMQQGGSEDQLLLAKVMHSTSKANIELINAITKEGFAYVGVDMEERPREEMELKYSYIEARDRRNVYMADMIADNCVRYQTGAVFLVGAGHLGIEAVLREKGFDVISFYTPGIEPQMTPENTDMPSLDFLLRAKDPVFAQQLQHRINILDKWANPGIKHIQGCLKILDEFFKNLGGANLRDESYEKKSTTNVALLTSAVEQNGISILSRSGVTTTSLSSHTARQLYYKAAIVGICAVLFTATIYFYSQFTNSEMSR